MLIVAICFHSIHSPYFISIRIEIIFDPPPGVLPASLRTGHRHASVSHTCNGYLWLALIKVHCFLISSKCNALTSKPNLILGLDPTFIALAMCYWCERLWLLGNHWSLACHRTFCAHVSSFHRYIFASILTWYIIISALQCLPKETIFDPCSKSTWVQSDGVSWGLFF